MNVFREHFNELLLSLLALIFTGCAIMLIRHGADAEGFKWAAGIVGTIVGALLMKMQVKPPDGGGGGVPPGPLPA